MGRTLQIGLVVAILAFSGIQALGPSDNDPLPAGIEECLQLASTDWHHSNGTIGGVSTTIETQTACLQKLIWKFGGINWADFNITEHDIKFINSLVHSLVTDHNRAKRQANPELPTTGFRIRREYRRLTDGQRLAYHNAVNVLKRSGEYDTFADLHQGTIISSAHQGPNFFGWHRVYLALYEEALRRIDRQVTIPYWDSSLDFDMANPVNSIIWSAPFLGNGDGFVTSGPFANWETRVGPLVRNIGGRSRLMSKEAIDRVLTRCRTSEISNPTALREFNLELIHGGPHLWVGGQMAGLDTASLDPVFFMHHAFVDYVWELFRIRQARVCGVNPETDYPAGVDLHGRDRVMDGFPRYRNIDGYQNYWTRNWYRYESSPTCRRTNQSCGSPYLRCDVGRQRCVSVARPLAGLLATDSASVLGVQGEGNTRAYIEEASIDLGDLFEGPPSDGRTQLL